MATAVSANHKTRSWRSVAACVAVRLVTRHSWTSSQGTELPPEQTTTNRTGRHSDEPHLAQAAPLPHPPSEPARSQTIPPRSGRLRPLGVRRPSPGDGHTPQPTLCWPGPGKQLQPAAAAAPSLPTGPEPASIPSRERRYQQNDDHGNASGARFSNGKAMPADAASTAAPIESNTNWCVHTCPSKNTATRLMTNSPGSHLKGQNE